MDLSQFNESYMNASSSTKQDLPDGKYLVTTDKAVLEETKDGTPKLSWAFRVIKGPHKDAKVWHHNIIKESTLGWLKRDLETAGLELENLADLPNRTKDLEGIIFEIKRTTKGDFANIYLNERVNARDAKAEIDDDISDDDIPF